MKSTTGKFQSLRGVEFCRACEGKDMFSGLDLGQIPIANELPQNPNEIVELFPLHFRICRNCGLGQVGEPVSRERLFQDYRYLSSISQTWLKHSYEFAKSSVTNFKIDSKDLIIEIASNDGYLLQYFQELDAQVLGVEPAHNVALIASSKKIPTINTFFGMESAKEIRSRYQAPKMIIANNVVAHVPNLRDFFGGINVLADDKTIISIENPSILNLLERNQFDTIYHEHYSYLSAHAMKKLCESFNLNLFQIEKIPTHGGSNRYWISRAIPTYTQIKEVGIFIESELEAGLIKEDAWKAFALNVGDTLKQLKVWLTSCAEEGRRVYGFAAAAKASTLLNVGKISGSLLKGLADSSPEKQHRILPSLGLPIISLEELREGKPTDVLIFSWNISTEISDLIWSELGNEIRCWVAIPNLTELQLGNLTSDKRVEFK